MARKNLTEAVAYLRTSSATNTGTDKDSEHRQREAIERYAKHAGFALVGEFYDAAVSGADPIEGRPGFAALLDKIEGNGVRNHHCGRREPLRSRLSDTRAWHPVPGRPRHARPGGRWR
jgi:hypothetical protein